MAMCSDSADNDDCQEEGRDNTSDAVEDDHRHCSGRRLPQSTAVTISVTPTVPSGSVHGLLVHMYGCRRVRRIVPYQSGYNRLGLVGTEHGVHPREIEKVGSTKATASGIDAVEDDGGGLAVVNSQVDDSLRVDVAVGVVTGLAADESDITTLETVDTCGVGQQ